MGERRRHKFRRIGRSFASRGRLVNHACREQVRPQPRILVRDRDYGDPTLDAPPTDPPELTEVYNTNWPSIRPSRYNWQYQDILNCGLLRVAGDTDPTPPSEALVRVWNNLDCEIDVSYGVLLRHSTSGRLRYFHASSNNATAFPVARTVSNRADLNQLLDISTRPSTTWDKPAGWVGLGFTGCYKHHVLCLQVTWCKQSEVHKSNQTFRTHSQVQVDPSNDQKGIDRKDVG